MSHYYNLVPLHGRVDLLCPVFNTTVKIDHLTETLLFQIIGNLPATNSMVTDYDGFPCGVQFIYHIHDLAHGNQFGMFDMTILELPRFPHIKQQWPFRHCCQMLFEFERAEVAHRRDIGPLWRDLKFESVRFSGIDQWGQVGLEQAFFTPLVFTYTGNEYGLHGR